MKKEKKEGIDEKRIEEMLVELRDKLKKIKMSEETVVLVSALVENSRLLAEGMKDGSNNDNCKLDKQS